MQIIRSRDVHQSLYGCRLSMAAVLVAANTITSQGSFIYPIAFLATIPWHLCSRVRLPIAPTCTFVQQHNILYFKVYIISNLRIIKRAFIYCRSFPYYVQVYQVRSLDRPLFIVFAQNSEGIIVTSQTREQGMMECAVSSSLFSVYAIKKRVH